MNVSIKRGYNVDGEWKNQTINLTAQEVERAKYLLEKASQFVIESQLVETDDSNTNSEEDSEEK